MSNLTTRGKITEHYDKELRQLDSKLRKGVISYAVYLVDLDALDEECREMIAEVDSERA